MATKLHTVGSSETNLKHYSCVSGQNHFAISMQPYTITLIADTATMIKYNNIWKAKTVCIINDKR